MITLAIFVTLRYLRGPDAWEKCFLPLPPGEREQVERHGGHGRQEHRAVAMADYRTKQIVSRVLFRPNSRRR